jgi:hypothetical protein
MQREIQSVVQGLRAFGWGSNIANMQAARAESLNRTSAEEMKWMEADEMFEEYGMMPKTRIAVEEGGMDRPRP